MAKSDITKEKIIAAAKTCYKKYGYKASSMDTIANEADISKSLLVHYFSKKHVILTTINKAYLDSIYDCMLNLMPQDPLTVMFATYTVFFLNILSDLPTRRLWFESMLRHDVGAESYNNSDKVYMPVFYKYNIPISSKELAVRKIQILGASRELTYSVVHNLMDMSDLEYIEYGLKHSAMLLGAPNSDIADSLKKCSDVLEKIDYSSFRLL